MIGQSKRSSIRTARRNGARLFMKYLAAFVLVFLPVFLLSASPEYETIPGEYITVINTAFTKFRSDMAKEGFDARLSDYFVYYRRLSSEYERRSNVLSVIFCAYCDAGKTKRAGLFRIHDRRSRRFYCGYRYPGNYRSKVF